MRPDTQYLSAAGRVVFLLAIGAVVWPVIGQGAIAQGSGKSPKFPNPPPNVSPPTHPAEPNPPGAETRKRDLRPFDVDLPANGVTPEISGAQIVWSVITSAEVGTGMVLGQGRLIVGCIDGSLEALSTADGRREWSSHVGAAVRIRPTLAASKLFVADMANQLTEYDLSTGRKLRSTRTIAEFQDSLTSGEGSLAGISPAGLLQAFRTDGLVPMARVQLPGTASGYPVMSGKTVVAATMRGELRAVDVETGALKWGAFLPSGVRAELLVSRTSSGEATLVAGSAVGQVMCFAMGTGREMWRFAGGAPVVGAAETDRGVIVAFESGRIVHLAADTGILIASGQITGSPASAPLWSNGGIVVGTTSGTLETMDTMLRRRGTINLGSPIIGEPVGAGGQYYVCIRGRRVYKLRF